MKTFDFTVVLKNKHDVSEDDAGRLFEAGCDDSTPGCCNGTALIHFSRDAESLQAAIVSAKADVEQAGFDVLRVELASSELSVLETP